MNTEISRIHFEAEYLKYIHCEFEADSKLLLQRNEDGEYIRDHASNAWHFWQASRAEKIKIPYQYEHPICESESSYNKGINNTRTMILIAGYEVEDE